METFNHFTCLTYDTIDFLIHSKYVLFGIYIREKCKKNNTIFQNELLPHIFLGDFLEKKFLCTHTDETNVMFILNKSDLDKDLQNQIVKYCDTKFPASGNFALSVDTSVSNKIIDLDKLKLMPFGVRSRQNACGITAIGFENESKSKDRRLILLSIDNILRSLIRGEQ